MKPALAFCLITLLPATSMAQGAGGGAATSAVEFAVGHAAFVDDAAIHHAIAGGSWRWYVSPRVSLGPELLYMRGPDNDRDLTLTGNVTMDLRAPGRGSRVMPFLVAGAGLFHHRDRFGSQSFSSSEGAFTAGAGVRAAVNDRWFVGAEWRVGWELHTRLNALVGLRLRE